MRWNGMGWDGMRRIYLDKIQTLLRVIEIAFLYRIMACELESLEGLDVTVA